jgi:hypothetical protein
VNVVPGVKSALTLAVLVLLLVVGVTWGLGQVSEPFPGKADPPICLDTSFPAGERIYPQDVTVSVLNASKREGLAGRTMAELTSDGFDEGQTLNAPDKTRVARVEVWTTDADNPAVLLVRSRLGQAEVLEKADPGAAGIVVVVGDDFEETFEGRRSIITDNDIVVCGPPL